MLPWFQFISFRVGPFTIYVWGAMVALGILTGTWVAARFAKARGQDPKLIWDTASVAALAGVVAARLAYVAFYNPAPYLAFPLRVFELWDGGMASMGAVVGALVAALWFLRSRTVDVVAYMDTIAYGTPLAYGIGRIGCFLIHDHPGTLTHFLLGVKYPDGVRHDLGLYEMFNGFGLFLLFLVLRRCKVKPPTYAITFLIWYGAVRFLFDFLRAADPRYGGLTLAQYGCVGMFVVGLVWAGKRWRADKKDALSAAKRRI